MRQTTLRPMVLEGCTTSQFIHYLMSHHTTPTTLIICSPRDVFLRDLLAELETTPSSGPQQEDDLDPSAQSSKEPSPAAEKTTNQNLSLLLLPTLHALASSRTIKTVYCPDLTHLLAYLSSLPNRTTLSPPSDSTPTTNDKHPILAILNPIQCHQFTSSFSAQGLNRTFACAVDVAFRLSRRLVMVETVDGVLGRAHETDDDNDDGDGSALYLQRHDRDTDESRQDGDERDESSPWDEQLSMLNVTTKTFGIGERGWVGRTVSVRQVAGRWCDFVRYVSD